MDLSTRAILPIDAAAALLVGRVHRPDIGPSIVAVRPGGVFDITGLAPTMADLLNLPDPVAALRDEMGDIAAAIAFQLEQLVQPHRIFVGGAPWIGGDPPSRLDLARLPRT